MSTKRITPEQVVAAYAKTGLRVARGYFFSPGPGGDCACGMGAIAAAFLGVSPGDDPGERAVIEALASAGYGHDYRAGFTDAFDGRVERTSPCWSFARLHEYRRGHADGKAAWDAVRPCEGGGK